MDWITMEGWKKGGVIIILFHFSVILGQYHIGLENWMQKYFIKDKPIYNFNDIKRAKMFQNSLQLHIIFKKPGLHEKKPEYSS